jgi:DNA-binding MarR family transcriptional regulator
MAAKRDRLSTHDYARLAAFRFALRGFLHFGEAAAAEVGLTSNHYQAMLILRGHPHGQQVTIGDLAQELFIKHNSAVGLVDRLTREQLVERMASSGDKRKVELRLTERGRRVLARLAGQHRQELRRIGPNLKRFFGELSAGESKA